LAANSDKQQYQHTWRTGLRTLSGLERAAASDYGECIHMGTATDLFSSSSDHSIRPIYSQRLSWKQVAATTAAAFVVAAAVAAAQCHGNHTRRPSLIMNCRRHRLRRPIYSGAAANEEQTLIKHTNEDDDMVDPPDYEK